MAFTRSLSSRAYAFTLCCKSSLYLLGYYHLADNCDISPLNDGQQTDFTSDLLELVNALFTRYETALDELLSAAPGVHDVEDAWFFMHTLFELVWQYRFLYRDLNDLLSKNRKLETHIKDALLHKTTAFRTLLDSLAHDEALLMTVSEREATATHMVVMLTWWLSYEYVRDPRHALEPESAQASLLRGAKHVLSLLSPFAAGDNKEHLQALLAAY